MTRQLKLLDTRARPLSDLRISVTDRCNFRCTYCMPKEVYGRGFQFLPKAEILSFEELTSLVGIFVELGVNKLRLTGGEPLLRSKLPQLIESLAQFDVDIALTTNGSLLESKAEALAHAGLKRITVSLDSLDDAQFRAMVDADYRVADVLRGINAARLANLPVKVNCVVRRGVNDGSIVDLARHFRGSGVTVRFIEFMDVGITNGWRLEHVLPAAEIVDRINQAFALQPLPAAYAGEVATRFAYQDGSGEVGVISSVTNPFCGSCSRARISAKGELFTCLFGSNSHDLRSSLRSGMAHEELKRLIRGYWHERDDNYSERRSSNTRALKRVEMSYIGG